MRIRSIVIAIALLATAAHAEAQDRTLERVENLIATGRLTDARQTLEKWEKENRDPDSPATPDDRARAMYLTGALSTDAKAAEDAFIGVVLTYPSSPVAPEALLRLGQALYTAGETDRALTYLERLRSDYPGTPQRETGMLWLTRAQLEKGNAAAACGTARESLFDITNANVRTLIEIERDRACAQSGGVAISSSEARFDRRTRADATPVAPVVQPDTDPAPPVTARPPAAQPPATQPPAQDPQPAATLTRRANPLPDLGIAVDENVREQRPADRQRTNPMEVRDASARGTEVAADAAPPRPTDRTTPVNAPEFAVQTAAFSERRAAETIAGELRAKGFDARIVQVPGSPFFRVRCGAFMTGSEAAAVALRIRDAGFATLVVNDVRLERRL